MAFGLTRADDSIDWVCPVNWLHPLSRGLAAWWIVLPNQPGWGSSQWLDIVDPVFGHHGTLTNMDPPTDWVSCDRRFYGALDFITDDLVNIGTVWDDVLVPANQFTCAANVFTRSVASDGCVFGINDSGGHMFFNDTGTWRSFTGGSTPSTGASAGGVVVDTWQFVAESVGLGEARVYVDGSSLTSASGTVTLATESEDTVIGASDWFTAGRPYNGLISSVHLYSRVLSADEHNQLYRECIDGYPTLLNRAPRRYYSVEAAATTVKPSLLLTGVGV